MGRKIPDLIKQAARTLRKNMTISERLFWNIVKNQKGGMKINRQAPIYLFTEDFGLDRYIIADFYCSEKKLIIEIDGSIHQRDDIYLLDREKEKLLTEAGYTILRFTNEEIEYSLDIIINKIKNLYL